MKMDPSNPNFDQFIESMIPKTDELVRILREEVNDKEGKEIIVKPVLCTIL